MSRQASREGDVDRQDIIAPSMAERARFICPNCKQKRGVNIDYGYPSHELFEQAERNETVLGGCMQALGDPDRQCLSCGHQWEIIRRETRREE